MGLFDMVVFSKPETKARIKRFSNGAFFIFCDKGSVDKEWCKNYVNMVRFLEASSGAIKLESIGES